MIGTPNAGSPIAQSSNICESAVEDLKLGATDTKVGMNPNKDTSTVLHTSNCHSNLLSDKEYQLAKPVLVGKQ